MGIRDGHEGSLGNLSRKYVQTGRYFGVGGHDIGVIDETALTSNNIKY